MRHHTNIHERFIRHIWSKQYLAGSLTTTGGLAVRVIHPGTLNTAGGPDFHNAKIAIGRTTYVGDVEIHRTAFDWLAHQHQEDPRYNKVVLHVVLEANGMLQPTVLNSGRTVPLLVLAPFLKESLRVIWQKAIADERERAVSSIPCAAKNDRVEAGVISAWLTKLAGERMEFKLRRFEERLRELALEHQFAVRESSRTWGEPPSEGDPSEIPPLHEPTQRQLARKTLWEQVLYEALFDALGFSKNRDPFVKLSRSASLTVIKELDAAEPEQRLEALLFGVAGLLPPAKQVDDKQSRTYVRTLRKEWNQLRLRYRRERLHTADWQFFPTRPANFPTARLAAGVQLVRKILQEDLFRSIIQLFKSGESTEVRRRKIEALLHVELSEFWRSRHTFGVPSKKQLAGLGAERTYDVLINCVLPIALLYSRVFKDKAVREGAVSMYESLPPSGPNAITRIIERQVLKHRLKLSSLAHQQAAIQLHNKYCAEKKCSDCAIGQAVFASQR